MVGIALLGAGLFIKEEHLPAVEKSNEFQLLAVYSRSQKSVEALSDTVKAKVDVYYDSPSATGKSLDDLLARSDISAVIVCLPIPIQPAIIKKALSAGKHVLSEKPVAKDVATGKELLSWYTTLSNPPIWGVAENFRFKKSITTAAEKARQLSGKLVSFRVNSVAYVKDDNKWYNTEWRKTPEYQGGFLLDGGIHFIAALRLILEAAGHHVVKVACFSNLIEERLLPVDTINAALVTQDGSSGTLTMSYASEMKDTFEIEVVTTNGLLSWTKAGVKLTIKGKDESTEQFPADSGVLSEVVAFAGSIREGKVNPLQSPEQGLKDVELMEALLESGKAGASLKAV